MPGDLAIMMVGDIFISTPDVYPRLPQIKPISRESRDLFSWLENVAPVLRQGDFTLGNLEGYIWKRPAASAVDFSFGEVKIDLSMPPETAGVLKRAGFNALSIANNHVMNMGAEAMLETIRHLDAAGIAHSGSGRNISEARKPAMLTRDGVTLAFLSYSSVFTPGFHPAGENKPGIATVPVSTSYEIAPNIAYNPGVLPRVVTKPNPLHVEEMLRDVRRARAEADVVVVSWHWGATKYAQSYASGLAFEDTPCFVLNYQEEMGRAAVDAGADIVMGHHPHRLQGIEVYKNKLICYSLNHLVLSFDEGPNFGPESVIATAYVDRITKQLTRFAIVPMMVPPSTMEPYIVPTSEAGAIIAELERLSKKYGTRFDVTGDEIVIKPGVAQKPLTARAD